MRDDAAPRAHPASAGQMAPRSAGANAWDSLNDQGDLVVTREWLDGERTGAPDGRDPRRVSVSASALGWLGSALRPIAPGVADPLLRLVGARPLTRHPEGDGGGALPASMDGGEPALPDDPDGYARNLTARETARPDPWVGRLTLRQKAQRSVSVVLALCLTLYLLLGGPAATGAGFHALGTAINARLHPPRTIRTLMQSGYAGVKAPPGAANLPDIALAPIDGVAGGAWACWATPFGSGGRQGQWTAHAFVTLSGGATWRRLTLPATGARGCVVSADPQHTGSAAIALTQGVAPDGSCIAPYLYLTHDGGATWSHAAWPLGPSDAVCQFTLALQDDAIYAWSKQPLLRGLSASVAPTGRVIVSRDHGQTWVPADAGLSDSAGLDIVGFRPGGRILATVQDERGSRAASMLMESSDYGASWQALGELPGAFPTVEVSSDPTVTNHGGWGRLYEVAQSLTNGVPDGANHLYLATAYVDSGWTPISLPPMPPGAETGAASSLPVTLGVGPTGTLEVERGIVEAGNTQLSPARRLWLWNPATRQWLLDPDIVPGNLHILGVSWVHGAQSFWLSTLQLGVPPTLQLFTKTYTAATMRHATLATG